jgi:hypothetical protein
MGPNNSTGFFGTKVSQPGINVGQANANQLLFTNDYDTETFYDKSGNARVILGKLPDSSYGMWVSAPGVNAASVNPNVPGQLVFNSNNDIFKILLSGSGSVTVGTTEFQTYTTTIAHNLGYTPIVMGFVSAQVTLSGPVGQVQCPYWFVEEYVPGGGGPDGRFDMVVNTYVNADNTNIYLNALAGAVDFYTQYQVTYNFKYYVLQETA